jgi:mannose/cellobiose epimerase-like protein (N-acyl-D-glucosamine 2-epimerase family)
MSLAATLESRIDAAHRFLTEDALPFWSSTGLYPNGCFVEHLDLAGEPLDPGFTRVRVQARQIYVFCHAQQTGLFYQTDLCERATEFFLKHAWIGPQRGWAKLIRRDGALIDGSSDLYDIAFALFALGWRYKVSGDSRCLAVALSTLDFLDSTMKHPLGGYKNDAAATVPRQQNPHMHLIEALCVWLEVSGDERFLTCAQEIVRLFDTRFHDARTGALGEFFNEDWTPASGSQGDIVEPGHQFEWAWIIAHYGRVAGASRLDIVERLIAAGLKHGYNADTGLTIDQVSRHGKPISGGHRLWPQTEALKASLAAFEFLDHKPHIRLAKILEAIFKTFLNPGPIKGSWIDHYDADGRIMVDKVPATSLYHVSLAFQELLRLRQPLVAVH